MKRNAAKLKNLPFFVFFFPDPEMFFSSRLISRAFRYKNNWEFSLTSRIFKSDILDWCKAITRFLFFFFYSSTTFPFYLFVLSLLFFFFCRRKVRNRWCLGLSRNFRTFSLYRLHCFGSWLLNRIKCLNMQKQSKCSTIRFSFQLFSIIQLVSGLINTDQFFFFFYGQKFAHFLFEFLFINIKYIIL